MLGFAHDWADREATLRSWDLVARYVVPEINGCTTGLRASAQYLHENQADLMGGASRAVMAKIMAHDGAAKAMATTMEQMQQRASGRRGVPARSGRADGSAGDDGEGDGGGVADVERVDVGGRWGSARWRATAARARRDSPGPSAPSTTATRAGHVERPDRLGRPGRA